MLTPPNDGTSAAELEEDDGLLTASEVAQLELDADWVVLSACNTAAGETGDAEALSGLARAFFYAKARALLVSHWYVNSDAAVKLTTEAFAELKANPQDRPSRGAAPLDGEADQQGTTGGSASDQLGTVRAGGRGCPVGRPRTRQTMPSASVASPPLTKSTRRQLAHIRRAVVRVGGRRWRPFAVRDASFARPPQEIGVPH